MGVRIGRGVDPIVIWIAVWMRGERLRSELVAARAGMTGGALRAWINGRRNPNLGDLRAVLNVLGYDLSIKKLK